MHKGRIKKRVQPVAPLQSLLAGSRTPFLQWFSFPYRQWLSFPAVFLLSGSISPFRQWFSFPAVASSRWSSAAAPWPAKASRWLSATVTPASNKPHPAEKSTPVLLSIWRTWAGFANSQHRDAAFATPNNIYVHILLCCHIGLLLRHSQISRPICTDCLRHLRISAK